MDLVLRRDPLSAWKLPLSPGELGTALAAMLKACGAGEFPLDLTLAGDEEMARCNKRYMNCPGPTNILSFPGAPLPGGGRALPSLLLSPDACRRESMLYGQDPAAYAVRLLAHGVVHLLGHDHGTEMDRLAALAEQAGLAALTASAGPCFR
jgi:probable rRNA maturation factor